MSNPMVSYGTTGRATITEAFAGGARMKPQRDRLTTAEEAMLVNALTGSGRLPLKLRVFGLMNAAPFPAQSHPHTPQPHQCYLVQLPDPGNPDDDNASGPSTLFIPTVNVLVDPHRFPQPGAGAPTAAAASAAVLNASTPFVAEDKFHPHTTNPKTWAREIKRLLMVNKYGHASEPERVQQTLDNVEDNTAQGLVSIHAARDLTADALLALIVQLYPLTASGAMQRNALRDRKATNEEAVAPFMSKLLNDWIQSFGAPTLAEVLKSRDAAAIKVWVQEAATLLVYSLPARHQAAATSSASAWVEAVETQAHLLTLMQTLYKLDTTAQKFAKKSRPPSSGVYLTPATSAAEAADKIAALEAENAKLRADASTGARGKRPPIDFTKPWSAKFGLCNTCRDDPQCTGDSGPREHWRKDCPLR